MTFVPYPRACARRGWVLHYVRRMTQTGDGAAAIAVEDIRKSYGDLKAVDGVSFSVAEGEFFGILGPNGAGKTTTLEIVEGLREPDSGSVRLLGESPFPRKMALLPRIGV